MKLAVNANVLFSFFKKDSVTRKLVTSFEMFELFTPSFSIEELRKHEKDICKKAEISVAEFDEALEDLGVFVDIVPDEEFKDFAAQAKKVSPHLKDTPYVALVLWLKDRGYEVALWSIESRLKKLEKHGVKVYTTKELLGLLKLKRL